MGMAKNSGLAPANASPHLTIATSNVRLLFYPPPREAAGGKAAFDRGCVKTPCRTLVRTKIFASPPLSVRARARNWRFWSSYWTKLEARKRFYTASTLGGSWERLLLRRRVLS